jgi:hypothetical protein
VDVKRKGVERERKKRKEDERYREKDEGNVN